MKQLLIISIGLLLTSCSTTTEKESNSTEATKVETLVPKPEPIIGERIDGPANIRDTIDGKILFELNDNTLVESTPIENDWLGIGVFVKLTKQQLNEFVILPGSELFNLDNQVIGITKDTIDVWMEDENDYSGFIGGVSYKDNIKPETVPEKVLSNLLEQKTTSKLELSGFITDFQFTDFDLNKLPNITQMDISQSLMVDMSPRDRITLLFRNDVLIGVVHSRELLTKSYKTYELIRGHKLTITSELSNQEIEEIRTNRIDLYNSVD